MQVQDKKPLYPLAKNMKMKANPKKLMYDTTENQTKSEKKLGLLRPY